MVDAPKTEMDKLDWLMLGHDIDTGKLPFMRLRIPLPATTDGLFKLAHDLSGLVLSIQSSATLAATPRHAVADLDFLIQTQNRQWQLLRAQWERELRERAQAQPENAGNGEQIRFPW